MDKNLQIWKHGTPEQLRHLAQEYHKAALMKGLDSGEKLDLFLRAKGARWIASNKEQHAREVAQRQTETPDPIKKPKFPALRDLTPQQLERLAKAHRKVAMKQVENPKERERLFRQANLARGVGKLKAKRLAKEKQARRLPANDNLPTQSR
jgi:hypothetical protein